MSSCPAELGSQLPQGTGKEPVVPPIPLCQGPEGKQKCHWGQGSRTLTSRRARLPDLGTATKVFLPCDHKETR